MTAIASDRPPDSRTDIGRGMEQFHHPRPVCAGRGAAFRPTPQRARLMSGLTGRVVEFGAGDGVKLTCYPPEVQEIVLVEPDPFLRAAAERVADEVPALVSIVGGDPARVALDSGSCDAVVHSLTLCCCARPERTLAEARRILRPGGRLRFYEHVRSANPVLALTEALVSPLWSRASGGCRPSRDPVAAIQAAGFVLEDLDRFTFQHVSHVLGTAVSPPS
ncbi:class I SAM-dependent methyltransferase [Nonomuraea sp. NPDC059007]|uniref:class I SAM-dependent methyltransferase n=1 Tax=Nonomuraea sp. NPDC059007 TaxID=3346692 RepID=UPI0036A9FCA7